MIHEAAFVSTFAHAREWFELARVSAGWPPDPLLDPWFAFDRQTVALIAHDARKDAMLSFVRRHFAFFDHFGGRMATGTTGSLLNGVAEGLRNDDRHGDWVRLCRAGTSPVLNPQGSRRGFSLAGTLSALNPRG